MILKKILLNNLQQQNNRNAKMDFEVKINFFKVMIQRISIDIYQSNDFNLTWSKMSQKWKRIKNLFTHWWLFRREYVFTRWLALSSLFSPPPPQYNQKNGIQFEKSYTNKVLAPGRLFVKPNVIKMFQE